MVIYLQSRALIKQNYNQTKLPTKHVRERVCVFAFLVSGDERRTYIDNRFTKQQDSALQQTTQSNYVTDAVRRNESVPVLLFC